MTARLDAMLTEGVSGRVFTQAQVTVLLEGKAVYEGVAGGAKTETLFDLSSLTKVLGTTPAFLALCRSNELALQTLVARFFPESPAAYARVTLADLLYHRSGLPAHVPYFDRVLANNPELLVTRGCAAEVRQEARKAVVQAAVATALVQPRGSTVAYSDVGFILLGEALALAANKPLDLLFSDTVFRPLGLKLRFHRLSQGALSDGTDLAPTGQGRPRMPTAEEPASAAPSTAAPMGEVDDDNAWAMDGVAGHAGLFGTARDVAAFGRACLEDLAGAQRLGSPSTWERALGVDASVHGSTRALGFDTPSLTGSAAGALIGKTAPGAFGHLGFTGVSLWVDRARKLVVALNTNRTLCSRAPQPIKAFRARFHDAVVEEL